jgi:RNA polymerase sigma-70 factor, ECF subfamily
MSVVSTGDDGGELERSQNLIDRAKAGDRDALEELARRYHQPLLRFLHGRLGRPARRVRETQDLPAEILMRAIRGLTGFEYRGPGSFWLYLRTIAFRYLIEVQRRQGEARVEDLLSGSRGDPADERAAPLEEVVGRENLAAYERALQALEPRERQAVVSRLELKLSYQAIAAELHFPSDAAARMAIKRAMGKMAKEMTRGAR